MRTTRVRRFVLVALLTLTVCGVAAVSARADAPDIKVSAPAPGQHPTQTGTATVDSATGHVTVDLTGGWSWPTHGDDCNTDRSGAGVSVDWFDPLDRGFHLAFFNVNGGAANTTPGGPDDFGVGATGTNGLNPVDDVVHPTENDAFFVRRRLGDRDEKQATTTTVTLTANNSFQVGDSTGSPLRSVPATPASTERSRSLRPTTTRFPISTWARPWPRRTRPARSPTTRAGTSWTSPTRASSRTGAAAAASSPPTRSWSTTTACSPTRRAPLRTATSARRRRANSTRPGRRSTTRLLRATLLSRCAVAARIRRIRVTSSMVCALIVRRPSGHRRVEEQRRRYPRQGE